MKLKVVYSVWGADGFDEPLSGGTHDLEDVTADQARSIAGAASAGAVEVLEASAAEKKLLDGHVQSQEDGEAARAAAQGEWVEPVYTETLDDLGEVATREFAEPGYWSGPWTHGNLVTTVAELKDKLAADDERRALVEANPKAKIGRPLLTEAERAEIERQIGLTEMTLLKVGVPE